MGHGHLARKHRKGRLDPALQLARTHVFAVDSVIDTDVSFPDRTRSITFSCTIRITGSAPAGVVFELGGTVGLAVWIKASDNKLNAAVGDESGNDGVTLVGPVVISGQLLRIVFAVLPGNGKAKLWVNDNLVVEGQSVNNDFPNGWSNTTDGKVGDIAGVVTTRVKVADRIALADASIVTPLFAYNNQLPKVIWV